jgi:hypothetical protein
MTPENDATVEAARTALVAVDWDGINPEPVAGLVLVLADELAAGGHSYASIAKMMGNISGFLASFDAA